MFVIVVKSLQDLQSDTQIPVDNDCPAYEYFFQANRVDADNNLLSLIINLLVIVYKVDK